MYKLISFLMLTLMVTFTFFNGSLIARGGHGGGGYHGGEGEFHGNIRAYERGYDAASSLDYSDADYDYDGGYNYNTIEQYDPSFPPDDIPFPQQSQGPIEDSV